MHVLPFFHTVCILMDILATHDLCYLDNINVIVCDHVLALATARTLH